MQVQQPTSAEGAVLKAAKNIRNQILTHAAKNVAC